MEIIGAEDSEESQYPHCEEHSAPIQEHSGISQQYQIYKLIGIDNDEILQKTAGLALE